MTEIIRVGVAGAGIGAAYIAGFQRQPGVIVASVCARTPRHLGPLVEKYHIPLAYTDYKLMLEEGLDVVVVATPNHLHHPMVMEALEAGANVLCEKPLALNVAQARSMVARAEQPGRKHSVAFTWRFLPAAAYTKEIIASGFLGQLYHANVRYFVRTWADPANAMRWQLDKPQTGSGSLANLGSHAIHLIQWWLGNFRRVCAMCTTVVKERYSEVADAKVPIEVDDTCAFLGELENGTPVVFNTSSVAWVPSVQLQIDLFGSEGAITFQEDWSAKDCLTGRILAMRKNDSAPSLVTVPTRLIGEFLDMPDYYTPFRTCFSRMAAEFVAAVREDRPVSPNFHDGLSVQEVIDALLRSQEEGSWITLGPPFPNSEHQAKLRDTG
jgi:predicted dehydrogenase